jgi:hypothetical protein
VRGGGGGHGGGTGPGRGPAGSPVKEVVAAVKERIVSQARIMEKLGNGQKLTDRETRQLANQVKDLMEGRTRIEVPIKDNTKVIFEKNPGQVTIGVKVEF